MQAFIPTADGYLRQYAMGLPEGGLILLMGLVCVVAMWFIRNAITPFDDHAKMREGNLALAIERGSFVLGQVAAMTFAVSGFNSDDVQGSLWLIAGKFAFITVGMLVLGFVVDWATLPRVANNDLLLEDNRALAVSMAGSYLGLGLILGSATVGSATTIAQTIWATIVFAVVGLATVILTIYVFNAASVHSVHRSETIRRGDLLGGLESGVLAISVSLVVRVGVAGDMTGWWDSFKAFGATVFISLSMVALMQWFIHRIATKGTSAKTVRSEGNFALMTMVFVGQLSLAAIVSTVVASVL